ncbi:MAG: Isopenicillin N epimerase component 2, partial [Pleopsidium flavum]
MTSSSSRPPLTGIRVIELASLAPAPFSGLLLADNGASVLRIDRPTPTIPTPQPTPDLLTRHKTSITLSLKTPPTGLPLLLSLIPRTDILIDPFRPHVLASLSLSPTRLLALNPRLIIARLTGFRRDGPYAHMAGHDINYLAVSGVLSQLGPAWPHPPVPPANLLADFGGGGMVCFAGIMTALFARERNGGRGGVVEVNMVDGVAALGTMLRLGRKGPMWNAARGENFLDGG